MSVGVIHFGTYAIPEVVYALGGGNDRFEARLGMDDVPSGSDPGKKNGSVELKVIAVPGK